MIYTADDKGMITGVITAHMVGYTDTLDAAGILYVKTEDRVDLATHWIERHPDGNRLVPRDPPLVAGDVSLALGDAWTGPVLPEGAVITLDGDTHVATADEPLILAPDTSGVYAIRIDHPRHMPSIFTLTVAP
jgi:hypothetical protein